MPRVFVSATSRDLRSYRQVVAEWAKDRGYEVVIQDDFATQPDFVTVVRLLRTKLDPCDAVVHLAGFYYGFEPTDAPAGEPRRSYTQLEYELARTLGRQVVRLLATEACPFDNPCPEPDELRQLQLRHRERLTTGDGLRYTFADKAELRVRLDAVQIHATVARPQNLPFASLGTLFKGRDEFLARLRTTLVAKPTHLIAVTAKQAIHGLGGVGKTRAAVEYGWRYAAEYTALLFVTADSPQSLEQNLASLCGPLVLNLPERDAREQAVQLAAAVRWLREHSGWFLIVDNVDTPEAAAAVEKQLANLAGGHVVVTSRLADWGAGVEPLELDVLAAADATAFLLEKTEGKRKATPTDAADAAKLAADLGGLALALEQAGAFVGKHRTTFADYRTRWAAQEAKVLTWFDERAMKYPRSVAVTWQTSVDQLTPDGRELLNTLCWLAPDPIPLAMVNCLDTADGDPPVDVEAALADLRAYSLLKWDADGEAVTVHRLVQDVTRFRLPRYGFLRSWRAVGCLVLAVVRLRRPVGERIRCLRRGLRLVDQFTEADVQNPGTWASVFAPAHSHMEQLLYHAEAAGVTDPTGTTLNTLGAYLNLRCEYANAEPLMRRSLALEEAAFRPDPERQINALGNLAVLLKEANRPSEAEPLVTRALAIAEAHYPAHSRHVTTLVHIRAVLAEETGQVADAETMLRRTLAIIEANGDPHDPKVATYLNSLALLLHRTNRMAEAEPYLWRAFAFDEATFGPSHPNVANRLNNLALLLEDTGRPAEAEPLFRRALSIDEAAFGSHPIVATVLNNLAALLLNSGRADEAEPLFRRALDMDEAVLAPGHPTIANRLNNLAGLCHAIGRLAEAESLVRRALSITEAAYPPDHPQLAFPLCKLARLLTATGRASAAEPVFRRCLGVLVRYQLSNGFEHSGRRAAEGYYHEYLTAQGEPAAAITDRIATIEAEARASLPPAE